MGLDFSNKIYNRKAIGLKMSRNIYEPLENSIDNYTLENGVRVVFEQNRHLNSVTAGVWIGVGSRDENNINNGISHMIEHMLFKGTDTMSAEQLAVKTAILGGNLNAYTSKENTEFYCKTLPEYLGEAIDILGDMICHSSLDEEALEKEKGVVCEEIDMYKDSPEDSVHEMLQKKIWRKAPLGYLISGKKKNVRAFTSDQLKSFMMEYYTGDNMVVSVAGKFNKTEALKRIKKAFKDVPPSPAGKARGTRITPEYQKVFFSKEKDIEQLHMNLAFSAPSFLDKERYAVVLLNAILGGDVNSRLFQGIREKYGLTYSVYSYGSGFSDTGLLHIYAAMNEQQKDKVYELIMNIINDMRRNGVKEEELENAKKQSIVEMTLNRDSTASLMSANAKNIIYNVPFEPFSCRLERINGVTLNDINSLIDRNLKPDIMSMGLIGPCN